MKALRKRSVDTVCLRCGEHRWPFKDWREPYTCQRCTEFGRGGHALDPLGSERSPAQQAAAQALGRRRAGPDRHHRLAQGGVGADFRHPDVSAPGSPGPVA